MGFEYLMGRANSWGMCLPKSIVAVWCRYFISGLSDWNAQLAHATDKSIYHNDRDIMIVTLWLALQLVIYCIAVCCWIHLFAFSAVILLGGCREDYPSCRNLDMRRWSEVLMICIYGPADALPPQHLVLQKSRMVLPFFGCWFTQVVLEIRPLIGCLFVCLFNLLLDH